MPLEITMTTEQKVLLTAKPMTAGKKPATVDGPVSFAVQSGECLIEPVDDMSAFIVSGNAPGDSTVLVSADADIGAGTEEIMDTVLVHVGHANAASLGLEAGTPEQK